MTTIMDEILFKIKSPRIPLSIYKLLSSASIADATSSKSKESSVPSSESIPSSVDCNVIETGSNFPVDSRLSFLESASQSSSEGESRQGPSDATLGQSPRVEISEELNRLISVGSFFGTPLRRRIKPLSVGLEWIPAGISFPLKLTRDQERNRVRLLNWRAYAKVVPEPPSSDFWSTSTVHSIRTSPAQRRRIHDTLTRLKRRDPVEYGILCVSVSLGPSSASRTWARMWFKELDTETQSLLERFLSCPFTSRQMYFQRQMHLESYCFYPQGRSRVEFRQKHAEALSMDEHRALNKSYRERFVSRPKLSSQLYASLRGKVDETLFSSFPPSERSLWLRVMSCPKSKKSFCQYHKIGVNFTPEGGEGLSVLSMLALPLGVILLSGCVAMFSSLRREVSDKMKRIDSTQEALVNALNSFKTLAESATKSSEAVSVSASAVGNYLLPSSDDFMADFRRTILDDAALLAAITNLVKSKTLFDVMSNLLIIKSLKSGTMLTSKVWAFLTDMFSSAFVERPSPVPSAGGSLDGAFLPEGAEDGSFRLKSRFAVLVACLMCGASQVSMGWFPELSIALASEWVRMQQGKISFVDMVAQYVEYVTHRLKRFSETYDPRDLFGINDSEMLRGDINDCLHMMSPSEAHKHAVDTIRAKVSLVASTIQGRRDWHQSLTPLVTRFFVESKRWEASLSPDRAAPVGFIVRGPPGCGKSLLVKEVARSLRTLHKLPDEAKIIQEITNTKHQQISPMHLIVSVNDAFQKKDEKEDFQIIEFLQAIADTMKCDLPAASLEDKAAASMKPEVVIVTTNNKTYHATKYNDLENKLVRRYKIVEMSYTDEASALAVAKSETGGHRLEVSQLLSNLTPDELERFRNGELPLVKYRIGTMSSGAGNVLHFSIVDAPHYETTKPNDFMAYLMKLIRTKSSRVDLNVGSVCSFGTRLPHGNVCGCPESRGVPLPQESGKMPHLDLQEEDVLVRKTPQLVKATPHGPFHTERIAREAARRTEEQLRLSAWLPDDTDPQGFQSEGGNAYESARILRAVDMIRKGPFENDSPFQRAYVLRSRVELRENTHFDNGFTRSPFMHSAELPPYVDGYTPVASVLLQVADLVSSSEGSLLYDPAYKSALKVGLEWMQRGCLLEEYEGWEIAVYTEALWYLRPFIAPLDWHWFMDMLICYSDYVWRAKMHLDGRKPESIAGWYLGEHCMNVAMAKFQGLSSPSFLIPQYFLEPGRLEGLLTASKIMGVVALAVVAYKAYCHHFCPELLAPEGNLMGSSSDIPVESVPVAPVESSGVPWLRASKPSFQVAVHVLSKAAGKVTAMWGVQITRNLIAVPAHLLYDFYGSKAKWDWDALRITTFDAKMSEHIVTEDHIFRPDKDIDVAYVYLQVPLDLLSCGFVSLNKEALRPPSHFTICNVPCTLDESNPRASLYYGRASSFGDCGLIAEAGGRIYGFHVGKFAHGPMKLELLSKTAALRARDFFKSKGFLVEFVAAELPAMVVESHATGKFVPEFNAKSDAAWFNKTVAPIVKHQLIGSFKYADVQKMNGRQSEMFPFFADHPAFEVHALPQTGHAKLIDGEWMSPVVERFKAVELPKAVVDHSLFLRAVKYISSKIVRPIVDGKPFDAHPISHHQALVGDPRNSFMNPRDNTKSVGSDLMFKGVNKKNCFIQTRDPVTELPRFTCHPQYMADYAKYSENLAAGFVTPNIATATLKNEFLPARKVFGENKGRLFYVCSLVHNVKQKEILLPILSHLLANPYDSSIAGAINPGSDAWRNLLEFLSFGTPSANLPREDIEYWDFDQKKFDNHHAELIPYLILLFMEIAERLGYTEEECDLVKLSLQGSFVQYLVMEGTVYLVFTTLSSGLTITLAANCLFSKLLVVAFCFQASWSEDDIDKHLRMMFCGDDTALGTCGKKFDGNAFRDFCKLVGYDLTDAHKRTEIQSTSLANLTFLKRSFRLSPGHITVWGCLAASSIIKTLCYITDVTVEKERERSLNTLMCIQKECFLHGESFFNDIVGRMKKLPFAGEITFYKFEDLLEVYLKDALEVWTPEL